ncbi:hypothetical protein WG66_005892 [Moniliophthora roreri]|nr:hypothetical protein WG66_005892 [Moniliophthora roreri]
MPLAGAPTSIYLLPRPPADSWLVMTAVLHCVAWSQVPLAFDRIQPWKGHVLHHPGVIVHWEAVNRIFH